MSHFLTVFRVIHSFMHLIHSFVHKCHPFNKIYQAFSTVCGIREMKKMWSKAEPAMYDLWSPMQSGNGKVSCAKMIKNFTTGH